MYVTYILVNMCIFGYKTSLRRGTSYWTFLYKVGQNEIYPHEYFSQMWNMCIRWVWFFFCAHYMKCYHASLGSVYENRLMEFYIPTRLIMYCKSNKNRLFIQLNAHQLINVSYMQYRKGTRLNIVCCIFYIICNRDEGAQKFKEIMIFKKAAPPSVATDGNCYDT